VAEAFEVSLLVGAYVHVVENRCRLVLTTTSDNKEEVAKSVGMQVASMGATTLSYKDFEPSLFNLKLKLVSPSIEKITLKEDV
jgi:elongation factor Ts